MCVGQTGEAGQSAASYYQSMLYAWDWSAGREFVQNSSMTHAVLKEGLLKDVKFAYMSARRAAKAATQAGEELVEAFSKPPGRYFFQRGCRGCYAGKRRSSDCECHAAPLLHAWQRTLQEECSGLGHCLRPHMVTSKDGTNRDARYEKVFFALERVVLSKLEAKHAQAQQENGVCETRYSRFLSELEYQWANDDLSKWTFPASMYLPGFDVMGL